jgi:hypothetical protein
MLAAIRPLYDDFWQPGIRSGLVRELRPRWIYFLTGKWGSPAHVGTGLAAYFHWAFSAAQAGTKDAAGTVHFEPRGA